MSKSRPKDAKEVEEYAKTLDYEIDMDDMVDTINQLLKEKDKLQAEKERLRKALEEIMEYDDLLTDSYGMKMIAKQALEKP